MLLEIFESRDRVMRIYGVFKGGRLVRTSRSKDELVRYIHDLPESERSKVLLAEKHVRGKKEHEQSHWMFS